MANNKNALKDLIGYERLFVAVVKLTIRRKEYDYFFNGHCEHLADYLGLDIDIAKLLKNRVAKIANRNAYFK
jgi:hypothetical protein